MTGCRWSHDSWLTAPALITTDVNKPVSYANPNHSWSEETITIDEQQEEDLLNTCFSDRPVSQTFTRTSCKPIWNDFVPPMLPRPGWIILEWECTQPVFISECTQHIRTKSQDNNIWKSLCSDTFNWYHI